jgi:hypothetical protein
MPCEANECRYRIEKITKERVEEVIESYKRMNWWP